MSVVSVLTGQHSFWGGVKLKSPMESTDISVSFADRIKKLMEEEKANKAEEDGPEGDEEAAEGEEVGGEVAKEGSHVEGGRGKPEEMGNESGIAEKS
jgi:hypothetical protein